MREARSPEMRVDNEARWKRGTGKEKKRHLEFKVESGVRRHELFNGASGTKGETKELHSLISA